MFSHIYHTNVLRFVLFFWLTVDFVSAHSAPAKPLRRVAHPSTHALEILPRQPASAHLPISPFAKRQPLPPTHLRHSDSFRLTISAFGETKFYLHLRPNEHLVHPAARINHYVNTADGRTELARSEPLLRSSVRAYWGEVVSEAFTAARLREDTAGVLPRPSGENELGWARIVVHHHGDIERGIAPVYEGAFSYMGVVHHVMTKENYLRNRHPLDPEIAVPLDDELDSGLVIWRESDVVREDEEEGRREAQTCGHDSLSYNTDPSQNAILQAPVAASPWYDPLGIMGSESRNLSRRDDVQGSGGMSTNFINTIGQTAGCPKSQKVLYMGVAADCQYVSKYGSAEKATTQILNDWNSASALYKSTFNVSLGIVELQIQNATCPKTADPAVPWNVDCSTVNLNSRLSLFSQWRGDKGDDGIGLWHLMSGCPTGTEVGIAWLATLCFQGRSGSGDNVVSGTAVSTAGRTEWQVVAHEMGHNFGAIHDCSGGCTTSSACCPSSTSSCDAQSKFIMSPVSSAGEMNFSPCSIGNICSVMTGSVEGGGQTNTSCLVDPDQGRKTISLQMCGNGIVEEGEDCDPGKGSNSTCCDASTCKFRNNAVCDPDSSPCCTEKCSFAPATTTCRPSKDSKCDTAEMCTGNSSSCPTDVFAPNGQSCGNDDLACASGICTSVAKQCQTVGASMNLKAACPSKGDNTCQISCQDPDRANQCVVLQSLLVDGSPCGYGGTCVAGNCQSAGFLDTAKAWYTSNLQISVPVTVLVGIVALLILWGIISALRRCSRRRQSNTAGPVLVGHQRLMSGVNLAQPPPVAQSRRLSRQNRGWVDPTAYNGR